MESTISYNFHKINYQPKTVTKRSEQTTVNVEDFDISICSCNLSNYLRLLLFQMMSSLSTQCNKWYNLSHMRITEESNVGSLIRFGNRVKLRLRNNLAHTRATSAAFATTSEFSLITFTLQVRYFKWFREMKCLKVRILLLPPGTRLLLYFCSLVHFSDMCHIKAWIGGGVHHPYWVSRFTLQMRQS